MQSIKDLANYILEGRGEVRDLTTGETWVLEPGIIYIVGPTDRHSMKVTCRSHFRRDGVRTI